MNYLNKIRIENPLTICYTNDVVKNFTANGLLSIGASPAIMKLPIVIILQSCTSAINQYRYFNSRK